MLTCPEALETSSAALTAASREILARLGADSRHHTLEEETRVQAFLLALYSACEAEDVDLAALPEVPRLFGGRLGDDGLGWLRSRAPTLVEDYVCAKVIAAPAAIMELVPKIPLLEARVKAALAALEALPVPRPAAPADWTIVEMPGDEGDAEAPPTGAAPAAEGPADAPAEGPADAPAEAPAEAPAGDAAPAEATPAEATAAEAPAGDAAPAEATAAEVPTDGAMPAAEASNVVLAEAPASGAPPAAKAPVGADARAPLQPEDSKLLGLMRLAREEKAAGVVYGFAEAAALPGVDLIGLSFPVSWRFLGGVFPFAKSAPDFSLVPWLVLDAPAAKHVIVAGEAVRGLFRPPYYAGKDVDVFIHSANASEADAILGKIAASAGECTILVTRDCICFVKTIVVRVARRVAPSAAAVLYSFDLAANGVGFDLASGGFLFTRLGALGISSNVAPVDVARRGENFEERLYSLGHKSRMALVFPQLAQKPGVAEVGNKKLALVQQPDGFAKNCVRVDCCPAPPSLPGAPPPCAEFLPLKAFLAALCAAAAQGDVDVAALPAPPRAYASPPFGGGLGWYRANALKWILQEADREMDKSLAPRGEMVIALIWLRYARVAAALAQLEALPVPPLWALGGADEPAAGTPAEWYGEHFNGLDLSQ